MSEIDEIKSSIALLTKLLEDPSSVKGIDDMSDQITLDDIDKELDREEIAHVLRVAKLFPEWLRQFKKDLPVQEWVDFVKQDLGPALAPLKDLTALYDGYIDGSINKTAKRVRRVVEEFNLSEETALRIVKGTTEDLAKNFKAGAEAGKRKKDQ